MESQQKADLIQLQLDTKQADFIAKLHKYKQRNIRLKAELQASKEVAQELELNKQDEVRTQNHEAFIQSFQSLINTKGESSEMIKLFQDKIQQLATANIELTNKLSNQSKSLRKTKYDLSTRDNENRRLSVCFSKGSEFKEQNDSLSQQLNQSLALNAGLQEEIFSLKLSAAQMVYIHQLNIPFFAPINI